MRTLILIALVWLISSPTAANPLGLQSVDDLITLIEQRSLTENREHQQREQRFLTEQNRQQRIFDETIALRKQQETRSDQLEKTYDNNEAKLRELKQRLDERLGSLKELFGHMQTATANFSAQVDNSATSADLRGRSVFLDGLVHKIADSDSLPSIEEMERLWLEMQREIIETGKVRRFNSQVISIEGHATQREVLRVGSYALLSDGQYINYLPDTGKLVELVRQPPNHILRGAMALQRSEGAEFISVGIDPTQGAILSSLVDTPSMMERIEQGGFIGYVILALGAIAVIMAIERMIYMLLVTFRINQQRRKAQGQANNPLGRIFLVYENNKQVDLETLELRLGEAILKERSPLERFLTTLKIIAVIAPLLGLLGTVTGMINTFQSITLFGTGDPKLMAGGISQALVTTILGLCVAIPTILFHALINSRHKEIVMVLEEQSTGLVAEKAERDRA